MRTRLLARVDDASATMLRMTSSHHGHGLTNPCLSYSILDEEDDIIAAHRQQIEDSMEMVQVMCDV